MKELNVGLNEHSQHDPPLPDTIPQAPTQAPSRPDVSSYPPPSLLSMPDMSSGSIGNVTRELWDVRREIAALAARETALEQQLKRLGSCPAPETPAATPLISTTGTPAPRDEISKLRAQLQAEDEARKVAERALEDERRRHELAEAAVADVRRECRAPFIVPALVDAFVQMSRIAGDVLAGAGGG
ncbi:uncharacterized protein C8Q71DRAFT_861298 [Rhodofomes roseus]|uniref:Uncharacterized protein n=1 Tax=Rhodofomes roseus TaxID=34475 RepID=A0ABQ8K5Y3_9APHY|nr:uncharacterized protein C8Q71DRAFT_861298 [Rhodofomes roseus]KAH9831995.1 hypothetical protein C8Q71DRAFT_861298 [Rhodofomes roseus]